MGRLAAPAGTTTACTPRAAREIIWDCQSWWAGSPVLEKYSACYNKHGPRRQHVDETLAHRNHVHIGLSSRGAAKRTSFWVAR